MKFKFLLFIFHFSLCAVAKNAIKKSHKPLFEWGLFVGHATFADYPGSKSDQTRTIPVPVFVYRGETFRAADEDGASARYLKSDNYFFDISVSGSFPASSENNSIRRGMPDLDWLMEFGPRFNYYFYRKRQDETLKLTIPWRAIYSTNFKDKFSHRGFQLAPSLRFEKYFNFFNLQQGLFLGFIARWGDEKIHHYFYEVSSDYVLPDRPQYNARSGFLGRDVFIGVSSQIYTKNFRMILGIVHSSFHRAKNQNSPLMQQRENVSTFIGLVWNWYQSEEKGYL